MIPIVAGLLTTLAQNGLGLLSSAIQAKGKEVVENAIGLKIPDDPSPEEVAKLRQAQFDHEERLIELGIEKAKQDLENKPSDPKPGDPNSKKQDNKLLELLAELKLVKSLQEQVLVPVA